MGAEPSEEAVGREILADLTGSQSHGEPRSRPKW
jgi:hypothetical protein